MTFATDTNTPGPEAATPTGTPAPEAPLSDPPEPKKTSAFVTGPQHEVPESVDPLLVQILAWPRRHASFQEIQFCKFLREHIRALGVTASVMADGCLLATVERPKFEGDIAPPRPSTTLFSCHIDTIEGWEQPKQGKWVPGTKDPETGVFTQGHFDPPVAEEPPDVRKKLTYDPNFGLICLDKDSIGGSLGADDGAGVWLMLKMIEAKVPGSYLFHRGEECGGLGSKAMAAKYPEILKNYEAAIAFDRHQTYEVITHQGGAECASDKFALALCTRLNAHGMQYEPSKRGVFTDTKNYRKLIAECVNVAVGYEDQHSRRESLDFAHLNALLDACCAIDWDSLPVDRDPAKATDYGYSGGYGNYGLPWDDPDDESWRKTHTGAGSRYQAPGTKKKHKKAAAPPAPPAGAQPTLKASEELAQCSLEEIEQWAWDDPDQAAAAIGHLLVEIARLKATVTSTMGLLGWKDSA
jgi:hypothetical protein